MLALHAVCNSHAFVSCYSTKGMFMKLPSTDARVVRSFLEKGIWIGTYSSHARGSVLKNTCRTDVSAIESFVKSFNDFFICFSKRMI